MDRELTEEEVKRINEIIRRDQVIQSRWESTRRRLMTFNQLKRRVLLDSTFLDRAEKAQDHALRQDQAPIEASA